jgi:hypothetical protein
MGVMIRTIACTKTRKNSTDGDYPVIHAAARCAPKVVASRRPLEPIGK